jgi:hypothetical protein
MQEGNKTLKVLVASYACNPFKGSEEGVGWGWVKAISGYHDLYVITASYHRDDIQKALSEDTGLADRLHFFYVPHKRWHYRPTRGWKFIENSVLKLIMNYAYRIWQRDAYQLARELNRQYEFDLIHQITYVGFRFPGHLWKLGALLYGAQSAGLRIRLGGSSLCSGSAEASITREGI